MKKPTVYWTMKDGTKISVDDMTVEHLRNTLKLIIKKAQPAPFNYHNYTEQGPDLEPYYLEFWKED